MTEECVPDCFCEVRGLVPRGDRAASVRAASRPAKNDDVIISHHRMGFTYFLRCSQLVGEPYCRQYFSSRHYQTQNFLEKGIDIFFSSWKVFLFSLRWNGHFVFVFRCASFVSANTLSAAKLRERQKKFLENIFHRK